MKGLTKLESLRLDHIPISDAAVAKLQKVLPNCWISHAESASLLRLKEKLAVLQAEDIELSQPAAVAELTTELSQPAAVAELTTGVDGSATVQEKIEKITAVNLPVAGGDPVL